MSSSSVLAAVAACLLVAGCSSGVPGSPSAGTEVARNVEPLTSAAAFDDIGAIDPCSLTDRRAFEEFADAELPGTPSMDECVVTVPTGEGGATLRVGPLGTLDLLNEDRREVADLSRDTTIIQASASSEGVCTMALVLADDVVLPAVAQADQPDGVSSAVLCGMARSVAERAFELIDEDAVRYWEPAENSLARVPACELLDAAEVAAQLGITTEVVTAYPAGHQCRWGRTGGDTATAKLDYPVGASPSDVGVPDSTVSETIAGRETWVSNADVGEIRVCDAITEQGEFGIGEGMREYVALRIAVPVTTGKDPCAIVRTLAPSAWAKLPAA